MGASGLSVRLSGNGDREGWAAAVWDKALDVIYAEVMIRADSELAYYLEGEPDCSVTGDGVMWWFSNPAGCCARSSSAWSHWFEHVLCEGWPLFGRMAEERGLVLEAGRPVRADLVSGASFVTVRRDLWMAGEDGLFGDNAHIPAAELTPGELEELHLALRGCRCTLCSDRPPTVR